MKKKKFDVKLFIEAFNSLRTATIDLKDQLDDFEKKFREYIGPLKKFDCVAFIMTTRNKEVNAIGYLKYGYACGFVAVPPNHPDFGKKYDEIAVYVQGGLTFAAHYDEIKERLDEFADDIEFLNGATEIPEGWYIVGFDKFHSGDSLESCPKEYCVEETNILKDQLDYVFYEPY